MAVKTPHLVLYEYGQGGVWAYVWAESQTEIKRLYPELSVVSQLPEWAQDHRLPSYLVDEPKGLLADILRDRSH